MVRGVRVLFWLTIVALVAVPRLVRAAPDETPELIVTLGPAAGAVPLVGSEQEVYSFQVLAGDSDRRRSYAHASVFVRPGQSRSTSREGLRIHGAISLSGTGVAKYKAELFLQDKRIASTSAQVILTKL